jgi:hypothetical protein
MGMIKRDMEKVNHWLNTGDAKQYIGIEQHTAFNRTTRYEMPSGVHARYRCYSELDRLLPIDHELMPSVESVVGVLMTGISRHGDTYDTFEKSWSPKLGYRNSSYDATENFAYSNPDFRRDLIHIARAIEAKQDGVDVDVEQVIREQGKVEEKDMGQQQDSPIFGVKLENCGSRIGYQKKSGVLHVRADSDIDDQIIDDVEALKLTECRQKACDCHPETQGERWNLS